VQYINALLHKYQLFQRLYSTIARRDTILLKPY